MGSYLHKHQAHIPTQMEPDGGATHKNPAGGYKPHKGSSLKASFEIQKIHKGK